MPGASHVVMYRPLDPSGPVILMSPLMDPSVGPRIIAWDATTQTFVARRSFLEQEYTQDPMKYLGVVGVIRLLCARYLIAVEAVTVVGDVLSAGSGTDAMSTSKVHQVTKVRLVALPGPRDSPPRSPQHVKEDALMTRRVEAVFQRGFYFSYTCDLTSTLAQRVDASMTGTKQQAGVPLDIVSPSPRTFLAEDADYFNEGSTSNTIPSATSGPTSTSSGFTYDALFWWNRSLCGEFIYSGLVSWVLPMVRGFVGSNYVGQTLVTVISRQSPQRCGMRWHCQGVDEKGGVAQYVETETLVADAGQVAGVVVARGSVPVYWRSPPDLTTRPRIVVAGAAGGQAATPSVPGTRLHFGHLLNRYQAGGVGGACVVCVDANEPRSDLGRAFRHTLQGAGLENDVRLVPCPPWRGPETLADIREAVGLGAEVDGCEGSMGAHFVWTPGTGTLVPQLGIVRVSCEDVVDTTDVLGVVVAVNALRGVSVPGGGRGYSEGVLTGVHGLWALNANALSMLYTGAPSIAAAWIASKGRLTSGGIPTRFRRYFHGNFTNGGKQDGLSLATLRYQPDPSLASPFEHHVQSLNTVIYVIMALTALMGIGNGLWLVFRGTAPSTAEVSFVVTWLFFAGAMLGFLKMNGQDYADTPVLRDVTVNKKSV